MQLGYIVYIAKSEFSQNGMFMENDIMNVTNLQGYVMKIYQY